MNVHNILILSDSSGSDIPLLIGGGSAFAAMLLVGGAVALRRKRAKPAEPTPEVTP